MKTICIALIIVGGWLNAWAQATRPASPNAPVPSQTPNLPANPAPNGPQNRVAPGAPGTDANPDLSSNLPPFALTNGFGLTNGFAGSNRVVNFGITNALSTLSPEHVRAVMQVQASLDLLQQAALKLRNTPNVEQAIDQSPYLQQQLKAITAEVNGLAQGPVRPSQDRIGRLSRNLVRALMSAQLPEDQQLVLSTAINQIANSGGMTQAQIDESISAVQAVLQSGGAPMLVVDPVTRDLRAVASELQPNLVQ